ncbi:cell envelope integrity protein CreD [Aquimarina intermedia]|uniref:Inner membrane protein n=1 Tax=Aquimarina intermedia TaxID=350814 RepID=A0A5S5BVG3_9FLAO|nr:cell envelope integrity protein CreD [Aquimarina intermedia]TYP71017.1 inner membrane protein [Aquimarina intermedia]
MKNLKSNIYFKVGIIIFLILILMIPTSMVENLIHEREGVQLTAIQEVSAKWGKGQTVSGPVLSIPFDKYVRKYNKKDSIEELIKLKEWVHFLPETLKITGRIMPEKRYRGIYEVVVYDSKLKIEGNFTDLDFQKLDISSKDVHFDKATLNFGINDLKGIEKQVTVNWNNKNISFNSGTATKEVILSGIHAVVPISTDSITAHSFTTEIDLKGSQYLYFTPVGKTTDVSIRSNWNTPSFTGTYLPDEREISEKGFTSSWNILHLNRNYPQAWTGRTYNIDASSFGTDLLLPVDNYKKSYRVARYAILFLVLTFITFFFVEVMKKVFIHPMHYLLVGIAIIVFYTLLLSISEHIKFNLAYIVASILTISLVSLYTIAILKSKHIGFLLFGILLIMYSFIFTIIQLQDYALLIGSLGMFIILCIIMFYARKIDWYTIKLGK